MLEICCFVSMTFLVNTFGELRVENEVIHLMGGTMQLVYGKYLGNQ